LGVWLIVVHTSTISEGRSAVMNQRLARRKPEYNCTFFLCNQIECFFFFFFFFFCGSERRLCRRHEQASVPGPHANRGTILLSRALSTVTRRNLV